MGLLSNREAPSWHPASAELKQKCKSTAKEFSAKGFDLSRLAIHYSIFSDADISCTLLGMASEAEVAEGINIVVNGLTLEEEALMAQLLSDEVFGVDAKNGKGGRGWEWKTSVSKLWRKINA
jgi:hypothetical protein